MKPICSNCRKEVLKITNLDLFNGRLCPSCYNKFSLEENEIIQSQSEKEAGIWVRLDELVSKIMIDNYDTSSRDYEKTKRFVSIYLGKIFKNTPLFQSGKVHGGFVRYLFEPTRLIKFLEIRDYLSYFNEKELIRIVPLSIQSNQSHHTILSIQSIQKDKLIVKEAETDRLVSMDRLETGQDLDNFEELIK